ncbi:MAG: hypothetical protein GHCLOJNM_01590 [bacterium]|nr:hypothetical protein [bacterium]
MCDKTKPKDERKQVKITFEKRDEKEDLFEWLLFVSEDHKISLAKAAKNAIFKAKEMMEMEEEDKMNNPQDKHDMFEQLRLVGVAHYEWSHLIRTLARYAGPEMRTLDLLDYIADEYCKNEVHKWVKTIKTTRDHCENEAKEWMKNIKTAHDHSAALAKLVETLRRNADSIALDAQRIRDAARDIP